jgi:hypothetical protein
MKESQHEKSKTWKKSKQNHFSGDRRVEKHSFLRETFLKTREINN